MKVIIFKAYNPLYDAEVVFRYNEHVISIIKKCFGCKFISASKKWMVPANQLDELIKNLESADFEVIVDLTEENPYKSKSAKPYKSRWDSVDNRDQTARQYAYKKDFDIPEKIHPNSDPNEEAGEQEKINSYHSPPLTSSPLIPRSQQTTKSKEFEPNIIATVKNNDGSLAVRLTPGKHNYDTRDDLMAIKGLIWIDFHNCIVLPKELAEFYLLCDLKGYKLEYIL